MIRPFDTKEVQVMPRRRSKLFTSREGLMRSRAWKLYQVRYISPLSDVPDFEEPSGVRVLAKGYEAEMDELDYGGIVGRILTCLAKHRNMGAWLQLIESLRDSEIGTRQRMFDLVQSDRLERLRTQLEVTRKLDLEPLLKLGILADARLQMFEKQTMSRVWELAVELQLATQRMRDQYALNLADEHAHITSGAVLDTIIKFDQVLEQQGFTPDQVIELLSPIMDQLVKASNEIMLEALKRNEDKDSSDDREEPSFEQSPRPRGHRPYR
jgi:hypothetical protein